MGSVVSLIEEVRILDDRGPCRVVLNAEEGDTVIGLASEIIEKDVYISWTVCAPAELSAIWTTLQETSNGDKECVRGMLYAWVYAWLSLGRGITEAEVGQKWKGNKNRIIKIVLDEISKLRVGWRDIQKSSVVLTSKKRSIDFVNKCLSSLLNRVQIPFKYWYGVHLPGLMHALWRSFPEEDRETFCYVPGMITKAYLNHVKIALRQMSYDVGGPDEKENNEDMRTAMLWTEVHSSRARALVRSCSVVVHRNELCDESNALWDCQDRLSKEQEVVSLLTRSCSRSRSPWRKRKDELSQCQVVQQTIIDWLARFDTLELALNYLDWKKPEPTEEVQCLQSETPFSDVISALLRDPHYGSLLMQIIARGTPVAEITL